MTDAHRVLRLRDQGDVLEAVPYLLGFHPRQSLVIVGLHQSSVRLTLRMDLDDARRTEPIEDAVAVLWRAGVSKAILIIYRDLAGAPGRADAITTTWDAFDVLPERQLVDAAAAAMVETGVAVLDALLVRGDQWWTYIGHESGCACCADGPHLAGDTSPVAAAATFAGMVAHADREALVAVLEPEDAASRAQRLSGIYECEDAMVQAALDGHLLREQRARKRALFAGAREADRCLIPKSAVVASEQVLFRHATALGDLDIRDSLWLAIDQGRLDGRGFWHVLLRQLPAPYDCAPLFLFGWATWREGNGALAAIAAERALASDPSYSAADLLLNAVRHGLDPFRTPRLRSPRTKSPSRVGLPNRAKAS
jgi:hypothetical protein